MPYVRQHIRCSHCLQYVFTPVHLLHNHVYAIENTYAEEPQHQIKPFSDIQAVMDTCPQAKYHNDGCINATAHHNHILEVVTDGFYVADTYGDERDAGSIDEDVDDRPRLSSAARNPKDICIKYCIASPVIAVKIIHREHSYRLLPHLTCR